jgi:hypothetical protein
LGRRLIMANLQFPSVPPTPEGGLAGFYRGTQFNYGIADAERQFRDADLANQRLTNLYQNELLDNPMKVAERESKIAEAGYNTDLVNSGAKREKFDADLGSTQAQTAGQKILNQKNEIIMASDALNQAAALPEAAMIGMWGDMEKKLSSMGVKFPQGGPSVENRQALKQMAFSSTQTVAHLNQMALDKQKEDAGMARTIQQGEDHFRATKYSADAHLRGSLANASAIKQQALDRDIFAKAKNELAENGVVSLTTIEQLGEAVLKGEGTTFKDYYDRAKTTLQNTNKERDKPLNAMEMDIIAEEKARQKLREDKILKGISISGAPISQTDFDKIQKEYPGVAGQIKKSGLVKSGPGPSGPGAAPAGVGAASTPPVQMSDVTRENRIAAAMKQNPGIPRDKIEASLIASNLIPKGVPKPEAPAPELYDASRDPVNVYGL